MNTKEHDSVQFPFIVQFSRMYKEIKKKNIKNKRESKKMKLKAQFIIHDCK